MERAKKVLRKIGLWSFQGLVWGVMLLVLFWVVGTDSTDRDFFHRSGIYVYIDHATGCHYLGRRMFGGLTPRLDASGRQVCGGDDADVAGRSEVLRQVLDARGLL